MILVIDNYDSFVHNLARYLRQLGCETKVLRNDEVSRELIEALAPQAIVISPGPGTPDQAGYSLQCVGDFSATIPILGVCLGHQAIVQAYGGLIERSDRPMHGRQSEVQQCGSKLFADLPAKFQVGRYHSLIAGASFLPESLSVTAELADGTIMAVEHRSLPVFGLQFHPESILTEHGYSLLANFCRLAGVKVQADLATLSRGANPELLDSV